MLVLNYVILNMLSNFRQYYDSLTDESKLVFYIIIILSFIAIMILLIILDRKQPSVQSLKNSGVDRTIELKEKTTSFNDVDDKNEKTRNLKEITQKIQEVIDNRNIDLTNFEQEQEENSIISYEELLKVSGKSKVKCNEEIFELPEIAKKIEVDEIITKEEPAFNYAKEDKFKKSDFISPIFGIQGKEVNNSIKINNNFKSEEQEIELLFPQNEIEEKQKQDITTADSEKEKFLINLKELRNNLS